MSPETPIDQQNLNAFQPADALPAAVDESTASEGNVASPEPKKTTEEMADALAAAVDESTASEGNVASPKPKKTTEELLVSLANKARKIRERQSELKSQVRKQTNKLEAKQALVVGTWIRVSNKELWDQVVATLTRDEDRKAFGLGALNISAQP